MCLIAAIPFERLWLHPCTGLRGIADRQGAECKLKLGTMWRIVVIEDHPIMRYGLCGLLESEGDMEICAQVESYEQGTEAILREKPDAALIDVEIAGGNGLDLIRELIKAGTKTKFLVVSFHDDTQHALRAISMGASGYITKVDASAELLCGVRAVLNCGAYFSRSFDHCRVIQHLINGEAAENIVKELTPREHELLGLMGEGISTGDMARRLRISAKTVETHRSHMREKLAVSDGRELARFAKDFAVQKRHIYE